MMNFIGIGIEKKEFSEIDFILLQKKAKETNIILNEYDLIDDEEISEGLKSFSETLNLEIIQMKLLSPNEGGISSSKLSEELIDFYLTKKKESSFINFFKINRTLLSKKFYIIYAFDWLEETYPRWLELDLTEIEQYFKKNASWNFYVYNYKKQFYFPLYGIPLIMEVNNKNSK